MLKRDNCGSPNKKKKVMKCGITIELSEKLIVDQLNEVAHPPTHRITLNFRATLGPVIFPMSGERRE